ncbi:MAG: HEPN domain-containing protein [Chloroflexota bacterium]
MMAEITMLSPKQTFLDNMRPAQLLLQVYRLLESSDNLTTQGNLLNALRGIVGAPADEDLMLIYNEIFLGLVRERANLPRSTLRQVTLCHMLRQAVVASCTAIETYLPALLRANLPIMIRARGRDFVPQGDKIVRDYFKLQFSLDETLRLLGDPNAAEYISNKIVGYIDFSYLSGERGVHVIGALLGLSDPWNQIATHLSRTVDELKRTLNETIKRRNDIVHRADRPQDDSGGEQQSITFAWAQQAVDTVNHVCLALDELVAARVSELETMLAT